MWQNFEFMLDLFLLELPNFSSATVWVSLLTLIFLEIVLGVDNIIFITISANNLEEKQQKRVINIGLILAMSFRILLLFGISYLIAMQNPIFIVDWGWLHAGFTGQSLVLIAGGLFLIYKSVEEIDGKLQGKDPEKKKSKKVSITKVIIQITLINIVFSFDSILTAIGLTENVVLMMIAVVISVLIMMIFAVPIGKFIYKHPTFQMLGLAFLLLIGFMLIAEGAHLSHLEIFESTVGTVPKGYLYFAIAFSLLVEVLNMYLRKRNNPVKLHGVKEEAQGERYFSDKKK